MTENAGPGGNPPPTLGELARTLAVYGNFTYGGGSATIGTIHDEIVAKRRWLDEEPFQLSYALSRLTPGTNLLAFTACIGYLLRRLPGAVVTLLAGSIPCSAMVIGLSALYEAGQDDRVVEVATKGALAAAVAVMLNTGVTLIRPHWRTATRAKIATFVGGGFVLTYFAGMSPLAILLVAGAAGLIWPARGPA
jgi:chromate transporter